MDFSQREQQKNLLIFTLEQLIKDAKEDKILSFNMNEKREIVDIPFRGTKIPMVFNPVTTTTTIEIDRVWSPTNAFKSTKGKISLSQEDYKDN